MEPPGTPAVVRSVPLASGRAFRTVRGTLAELAQIAAADPTFAASNEADASRPEWSLLAKSGDVNDPWSATVPSGGHPLYLTYAIVGGPKTFAVERRPFTGPSGIVVRLGRKTCSPEPLPETTSFPFGSLVSVSRSSAGSRALPGCRWDSNSCRADRGRFTYQRPT